MKDSSRTCLSARVGKKWAAMTLLPTRARLNAGALVREGLQRAHLRGLGGSLLALSFAFLLALIAAPRAATQSPPPEASECVDTELQAALTAASSGSTVAICNGTYELASPLKVPAGVTLAGETRDGVVLRQLNELGAPMNGGGVVHVEGADGARDALERARP